MQQRFQNFARVYQSDTALAVSLMMAMHLVLLLGTVKLVQSFG
jgi:hypothetical protein